METINNKDFIKSINLGFNYGTYTTLTGRIKKLEGSNVRLEANPSQKPIAKLNFNDLVAIDREYWPHGKKKLGWYHIYSAKGQTGWIRSDYINIAPSHIPLDSTLKVLLSTNDFWKSLSDIRRNYRHIIVADSLWEFAHKYYKTKSVWGQDTRLFIFGIAYVNQQTDGITIPKNIDFTDDDDWEKLNRVRSGTALWLPKKDYILHLRDSGIISSGSVYFDTVQDIKRFLREVYDWIIEGAGIAGGLIHGALMSIYDIFADAVGLVKFAATFIKNLFTKGLKYLLKIYKDIVKIIENIGDIASNMYKQFMSQWNAKDAWDRGYFRGTVIGYLLGTSVLIILTMGAQFLVKAMGKSVRFAAIAEKVAPKIQKTANFISKASKLPGEYKNKMASVVKGKFSLESIVPQPAFAMAGVGPSFPGRTPDIPKVINMESRGISRRGIGKWDAARIAERIKKGIPFDNWSELEKKAYDEYWKVFKESNKDFKKAGTAFHDAMGAAPSGADIDRFGFYTELKTSLVTDHEKIAQYANRASSQNRNYTTIFQESVGLVKGRKVVFYLLNEKPPIKIHLH